MPRIGLRRRISGMAFVSLLAGSAMAQLEGRFFLEKSRFAAGEPVFLEFELTNGSADTVEITTGTPYGCGGYSIELIGEPGSGNSTCPTFVSLNCLMVRRTIDGGTRLRDSLLLDDAYILRAPGRYELRVRRQLPYGAPGAAYVLGGSRLSVEDRISFEVTPANSALQQTIYDPYLADLSSPDELVVREAARVIGSIASPFLEDSIFGMLELRAARTFALRGLMRLDTPRSRQALAEIIEGTSGSTGEKAQAVRYLSASQDLAYLDLLIDQAGRQPSNAARFHVESAARLGGDNALPWLTKLLASPDPDLRGAAIVEMRWTGSRSAVPILIDLLLDPDVRVGGAASSSLRSLTHRQPERAGDPTLASLAEEHQAWSRWWARAGANAPVFRPDQCGVPEAL